jgi:hypothetical protein
MTARFNSEGQRIIFASREEIRECYDRIMARQAAAKTKRIARYNAAVSKEYQISPAAQITSKPKAVSRPANDNTPAAKPKVGKTLHSFAELAEALRG